jgi:hypothetical protein
MLDCTLLQMLVYTGYFNYIYYVVCIITNLFFFRSKYE